MIIIKIGDTTDELGYQSASYYIGYSSQIQLQNNVYSASNDLKVKENVKLEPGKTAKYATTLVNDENTIKNISIVSRLPFIGNKTIIGSNLLELGTTVSLENLKNIEVYEDYNGQETKLDSDKYEISYSSEETANIDSVFDTSEAAIATAKTLKIKMSDSYKLYSGNKLIVKYELDVPEVANVGDMASQISAVKYTDNENNVQTLEGMKSTIEVGNSSGIVEIVKKFEGENNPESVANIEFKITNMDDETKYYTGTTDARGHVTFTNVPVGDYEITEITEFENYEAISPQYVTISNGEEYTEANQSSIIFENKMKLSKIEIIKTWEDTNEKISNVGFEIQGTAINGEQKTFTTGTSIEDDGEGNKIQKAIVYVPYGNYTIKENKHYGWYADDVIIEVNQETIHIDVENKVTKGILQLVKTVPDGDSVEGLTFKITGVGDVSYINKEGNEVLFETDMEVQITEENESIEISEDKRTAIINIPDMPVGTYTVEEINMPKLDTEKGMVTKYVSIRKSVKIPNENGKITILELENKHKKGIIDINVTATEGAELENFKVKVSGISYYGNVVDQIIDVPTTGKVRCKDLEIGKYKVEECNTVERNGKIYTTDPDGFEVTYSPETANSTGVEVEYLRITDVDIHNEYTAKGIVKIEKSLEDETDVSKAKGIEFAVVGKDLIGRDVNEIITIGEDGTGTSDPIPVGTYLLSEVESTVPEIYELIEEQEITIKSENDETNPLILTLENKLAEGNIVMETELVKGGYPETPVTYTVTKVDDNLEAIGEEPIDIEGDIKSKAKLTDMKAGKYLVEQKIIPEGYEKDTRQVVNITRNEEGYALFLLDKEKEEEFDDTTVTIQKELLNEEGETASTEDFIEAKLDVKESYSFEVRLRNTETNQIYYSFVENNKIDIIQGLPYGTYEVEEVYKPKYKILEITGEDVIKNEETGVYTFTLSSTKSEISLIIKNQIDTNFGFGGQDSKDNLSKILLEEIDQVEITKARIYVRDEQNNKISNADFKLYNMEGQLLKLSGVSGTYSISEEGNEVIKPVNGLITLKSLPVGKYRLVNERVKEGLLKSDDKIVTVYQGAVGVRRIELLKDIPRGSLRLSTTYTDDSGETKYVPRSKYKILNKETGEVLTFIRKVDGTWTRSNLPNATKKISLKAGYIDVEGIEAGIEYKVGVVDVTEKYRVSSVDTVNIIEGERKEINAKATERGINYDKIRIYKNYSSSYGSDRDLVFAIDDKGNGWSKSGKDWKGEYYNAAEHEAYKGFKDIILDCGNVATGIEQIYEHEGYSVNVYLDKEGKVHEMYYNAPVESCTIYPNLLKNTILDNIKLEKIAEGLSGIVAIDENGKVWNWSYYTSRNVSHAGIYDYTTITFHLNGQPKCISETNGWEDTIITDISGNLAIDKDGKLWNYSSSTVECLSEKEGSRLKNVKIKKVAQIPNRRIFCNR